MKELEGPLKASKGPMAGVGMGVPVARSERMGAGEQNVRR